MILKVSGSDSHLNARVTKYAPSRNNAPPGLSPGSEMVVKPPQRCWFEALETPRMAELPGPFALEGVQAEIPTMLRTPTATLEDAPLVRSSAS